MKTLLDALIDKGAATNEDAVYVGREMLDDPDMCMRVVSGTVKPPGMYYGLDLYELPSLVGRTNYEWWWRRWGKRVSVVLIRDDYACLVRIGFAPDVPAWERDPAYDVSRVFVDLTATMDAKDADQLAADYVDYMSASFAGAAIDEEALAKARDGVIGALWEVEREDPIDFIGALVTRIIEEMGLDPKDEDARQFVETSVLRLNLRQLYEDDWGGEYRVEPDDSWAENEESDESAPVAGFVEDDATLDAAMRDPAIRDIYQASRMAMNG